MRRLVFVALGLVACRLPASEPDLPPVCVLSRAPREHADTIRIVVPTPVDPAHAPVGINDAERLVFAQLYEPLLLQDCAGTIAPGMAEGWSAAGDSAWRFKLKPARFSDGTPATGQTVAAALAVTLPQWKVTASNDRDVVVRAGREPVALRALSAYRTAIVKALGPGQWPAGTRGSITAVPHGVNLKRGESVIAFTWPDGADARDLLEGGADAVLTDQPAAIEYAAARGAFDGIPLPWSRTYVALLPSGRAAAVLGGGAWRDAVRGEAQPAAGPFWWATAKCTATSPAPPAAAGSARVVYAQGDAPARGLAERLVARGLGSAAALPPEELSAAVAAGKDFAIVALPRSPVDPCGTLAARGLAGRSSQEIVPLLDTRFQLVVRSGRFGVLVDGDGTLRLDP